jgi:hypothetical protein
MTSNVYKLPRIGGKAERKQIVTRSGELLQAAAEEAALHIYNTMLNTGLPPDLRLRAAMDILDRTTGKSVSQMDRKALDALEERTTADYSAIPTDQIEVALRTIRGLSAPPEDDGILDAEFSSVPVDDFDMN